MEQNQRKRITGTSCENSYVIPNTKITVEEHNMVELEELWVKLEGLSTF
jgi:hypothetical protein